MGSYISRISFLDGQILQDFHLNSMQKNIAESFKVMTVKERYDMKMLVSPYDYYFSETFTKNTNRSSSSTATIDQMRFLINQGFWVTRMLELPVRTKEVYLLSEYQDDPAKGSEVKFYYRAREENAWIQIEIDEPIHIPETKHIQIKVECNYTGVVRPEVYDFALYVK